MGCDWKKLLDVAPIASYDQQRDAALLRSAVSPYERWGMSTGLLGDVQRRAECVSRQP